MPGRVGRVGDGVTVAALAGAVGLDIDVAIVLGAAEGTLPPRADERPVAHRRRARRCRASHLRCPHTAAASRPGGTRRHVRAHVHGASRRPAIHGPCRADRARLDRWTPRSHTVTVDSHTAGLAATVFPVSASEHRLRARATHVRAGGDLATVSDVGRDVVLSRAISLTSARRHDEMSAFDGDLSSATVPRIDGVISPSQLETWAACPHAYFMHYLLRVTPIEEPADQISITASDIGTTQHAALDQFHRAVIAGVLAQPTEHGWTDEHHAALDVDVRRRVCPRPAARPDRTIGLLVRRTRTDAGRPVELAPTRQRRSSAAGRHRGGVRATVRRRFARRTASRPGPRRRPDDRAARHRRPDRPDRRWHDRRHRSQDPARRRSTRT